MENTAVTAESPKAEVAEAVKENVVENTVEKPNSKSLLDFAKKEADFAKKEVARKEEINKLQEQLKSYEEDIQYYRAAKDHYKKDPEALLKKLGISYDELTEAVIDYYDRGGKDRVEPLDRDAVRKEIEAEFKKQESERLAAETAAAVEAYSAEINAFVEANAAQYPYLTNLAKPLGESESPQELIFGVVENYWHETGQMLSLADAARVSEEYLRDEWEKLNGTIRPPPAKEATPETPVRAETDDIKEKIVEPPKETHTALNANAFKRKDYAVNNGLSTKTYVPYKNRSVERNDIIEKAVRALENAAVRK